MRQSWRNVLLAVLQHLFRSCINAHHVNDIIYVELATGTGSSTAHLGFAHPPLSQVHDLHPSHAFLVLPDKPPSLGDSEITLLNPSEEQCKPNRCVIRCFEFSSPLISYGPPRSEVHAVSFYLVGPNLSLILQS